MRRGTPGLLDVVVTRRQPPGACRPSRPGEPHHNPIFMTSNDIGYCEGRGSTWTRARTSDGTRPFPITDTRTNTPPFRL
ncbi:hypothetical protein E2C01_068903 [Portunus trituberculatus]|uniref:Uncharacterized protein n=1 Tax=Portunus trituberculatus TaxID=210409 RepID=A0A5B7HX69_PORTR|nr:hypothetical protein [Portunus trituberculatus]